MEEYLHSLQKELKGFPPEEQAALMEEVASHIESGESDPNIDKDPEGRSNKLMHELGSPEDMGRGFQSVHRPNRFVEYLLVAIPFAFTPYFTQFYLSLRPQYPWMDIRLNVIMDLVVIAIALWKRSALVTLFWINLAVMQLSYIVLQGVWQPYWYFGLQTIVWAMLLIGLLALFGQIVWKNRQDALIVVYALLPILMLLLGTAVWSIRPVSYFFNPLDRSLLRIFVWMQGASAYFYGTLASTALFFLASNRDARWIALVASGLMIGLGRIYLFDYQTGATAQVPQWVYYFYALVPVAIVGLGWWQDHRQRQQMQLAV